MSGGVSIKYNNEEIASMSSSGTKTLLTKGKYCNSDIQLDYEKPAPAVVPLHADDAGTYTPPTGKGYGSVVYSPEEITDAVRFFDYDGTLLHQYTATQFLALSSMPSNPSHTGLTAQGWNWSLAEAQEYVSQWGFLDIGQMYVTSDGTTQINIELHKGRLAPYLGLAVNGTVSVDWGDGSSASTVTGTSLTSQIRTQHIYANEGNYTIKINVTSGSFAFYGTNAYLLLNSNNSSKNYNQVYASAVKSIRIGNNCIIGNYAFNYCYSLSSITIPSSVTSIGSYAFQYCYSLSSITIPSSVTSINNYVFRYCYSLSSVTIPSSITSIGDNAFQYCYSLSSITIPSSVTSIEDSFYLYYYSRKIIPLYNLVLFRQNDYNIQSNITLVSREAFYNCYSLSSITIPSSVTSIGSSAFENCYSLSFITIPSSVTSIGNNVFTNCTSLSSVTIPSSVTSISTNAFYNCYSLSAITIPSLVTSIGSSAFTNCYSLSSITIPSSVTSIGNSAFTNCVSLSSVTISSSVTSIGDSAFSGCGNLSSITIPSSVTSIGNSVFNSCYSLSSITIPSSVTSIGNNVFYNCYGVAEYHIQATTPPTLGTSAFTNIVSDCKIYVPSASLSTYQSATNWSTYASYMVGE